MSSYDHTTERYKATAKEYGIPDYMVEGLENYVEHHIAPGSFLYAVITNDLRGAVERADDTNIRLIHKYVGWFYNHAPHGCWGSPEAFENWITRKENK